MDGFGLIVKLVITVDFESTILSSNLSKTMFSVSSVGRAFDC